MANKINAIQALKARLEAQNVPGSPLADIKRVRLGPAEEARKSNDFPIINIELSSGNEQDYYSQHGKVDKIDLQLSLICSKLPDEYNAYYAINPNTSALSGPLYLFEQLLNVLDKTSAGVVDLSLGGTLNRQIGYSYEINTNPDFVEFALKIQIETAQFQSGSR